MKTIEIDGKSYLIDIEKATEIGIMKVALNYPRSWNDYVLKRSLRMGIRVDHNDGEFCRYDTFSSKEETEAFHALGKLIQLRDAWWGDWRPDWEKSNTKYGICTYRNKIDTFGFALDSCLLAFPTEEMCKDFLETFRDLIEEAKMFL